MKESAIQLYNKLFNSGNERSQTAKNNMLYSFVIKGINVVISMIYVPLLIHSLGAEKYGVWLTLYSIVQWIGFFDFGLGNGLRNRLTESIANNDRELSSKLISTSYILLGMVFSAIFILYVFFGGNVDYNKLYNSYSMSNVILYRMTFIVMLFFCLQFILYIIKNVLFAFQRTAMANSIYTVSQLVGLLGLLFVLKVFNSQSLVTLSVVLSANTCLVLVIYSIVLYSGKYRDIRPKIKNIDFSVSKGILGLGSQFFIVQMSGLLIFSSSNVLISQVLGPEMVTPYQVAYKLFFTIIMLNNIIVSPMWSAVTDAFVKKEYNWLENALKKMNKVSVLFSFLSIILLFASPWLYKIWVGDSIKIPFLLSAILCIYTILTVFLAPYTQYVNGFGKLKIAIFTVLLNLLVFFPIAIILMNTELGVSGIVIALCLVQIIGLYFSIKQVYIIMRQKNAKEIWLK